MSELAGLLPAPDDAPRCSVHTRNLGLDPVGSALRCDQLLVVEVPLPWPKPVGDHPLLQVPMRLAADAAYPSRLLAARPRREDGAIRVTRWRRDSLVTTVAVHEVGDADELAVLVDGLTQGRDRRASLVEVEREAESALLLCTQGSHDVCCGTEGTRLAGEVQDSMPELDLYQVSHTGGHRFAPTGMVFPSGRMWAGIDLDLLRTVLDRSGRAADVVDRVRGWWGAERGAQQAAERAAFGEVGWSWEDEIRVVTSSPDDLHVVQTPTTRLEYRVTVLREVPTIACRSPGGQPAKVGYEYVVERL